MQNLLAGCIEKIKSERTARHKLLCIMLALSLIVAICVYWQLKLTGVALANEYYCGLEEHTHTDECYEYVLVCGYEESEVTGHVHTDECYLSESVLVCGFEESEGHTHDETCYDEEGNLICGLEESEGHTHAEACYEIQQTLICTEEESEGHVHTEECYELQPTCGFEEHTHSVECMIDETADLETAEIWEATLPELTGVWADDVVSIARSQLGYSESTANYTIADDGETHKGYTRYGEWAGNPYGDWDGMFASFCLSYAGISREIFPESTGAYAWSVELRNLELFAEATDYFPEAGDLIFFDKDSDGKIDHVGIVETNDGITLTVIEGNVDDAVSETYYAIGDISILGYGVLPVQSADEETETDDEEIILEETEESEAVSTLVFCGDDYVITVTYGEDAALPEGTELIAYEYSQDSENYIARYAEASLLYGWDTTEETETDESAVETIETDVWYTEESVTEATESTEAVTGSASSETEELTTTDPYHGFRLFNIGLYCDGVEIEPAAAVTVTIVYTGDTGETVSSVSVTHFTDTSTEPLAATVDRVSDSQVVTFTADGFSEFGIMLTSLAAGVKTVLFSELTDTQLDALQIEIDNTITEDGKLTAYLYYLDDDNDKVYVYDYVYDDNGDPTSDTTYFVSSYTKGGEDYTVTYTWYRSKEPYLTDSGAPKTGYADTSTANYNYLLSTSSAFYAKVTDNYCSVVNGSYSYLFYYYYVGVSITTTENNETVTKATYETAYNDIVYAFIDPTDTLNGAATYVVVTKDEANNTLTATLYDSNGVYSNSDADAKYNENITYTYTWYKSRTYEATDDLDSISASDAPYANTIANTNDYVQVKTTTKTPNTTDTLTLTDEDSFYFYYLIVTLNYTPTNETKSYAAYADGYDDYAYAGYVNTSGTYKAVIIDDLASSGTFKAVLYNNTIGEVVSGNYTYTWYKSDSEYEITNTYITTATANSSIYSDQNVPSGILYQEVTDSDVLSDNTINVAKDTGGLHYYKVVITTPDGKTYESALKFVQYSDEIENGGFEIGTTSKTNGQYNELYVAYWHTTNGEYTEYHGSYRGYNSIELSHYAVVGDSSYGTGALSASTYAIAYTKAGNAAQDYFAELNATEASTLYQSVITAPGTTYYWSFYHQNRKYTTSTNSDYIEETEAIGEKTLVTYKTTGTDSMYVIIMSDEDAEKLLAEADKNSSYSSEQDAIDAAAAYILVNGTKTDDGSADNGSDNPGSGTIDGSYSGKFELSDGTTVDVTLWQVTTTKTVTRVYLYNTTESKYFTSSYYADASSLSSTYSEDAGWAEITGTVNGETVVVGYYKVTDWVKYTGSYTVPEGQYLTRFFFATAYAQGGVAAGNFIDGVSLTYAIDYTIEYWVWDYEKCKYVKKEYEEGSTTPYQTVYAQCTGNYSSYGFVGSVTSYESGGENPKEFDDTKNISLYVDAYNYVLSLYYGGPGVIVDKVISGVSTAALDALDTTVTFTITNADTSVTSPTTTLDVTVKGAASGESSEELDEGTYTIVESYDSSLFNGKYVWVGVDVTGATYNSSSGKYEFEITSADPLPTVTYTNNYLPVVTLKKVDSTDSTELSGVKFVMYKITDETSGTKSYYSSYNSSSYEIEWSSSSVEHTTDGSGEITFSALPDGTYYLEETATIDGYNTLTETLSFTVSGGTITAVSSSDYISIDTTDSYGLTLIVENDPGMVLPETGGEGTWGYTALAGVIIIVASLGLVVMAIRRRRNAQ